jgi:exopolysaccharide production protein ExoQ
MTFFGRDTRPLPLSSPLELRALLVALVCLVSVAPYAGADIAISAGSVGVSLAALRTAPTYQVGARAGLLVLFGGLCLLSMLWSVAPFSTLPSAAAVLLTTIAAVLTRRVMSRREVLLALAIAFRVVLVVSVLVAVAVPSVGLVDESYQTGALKGLFGHRNLLAFMALVSLATFVALWRDRSRRATLFDVILASGCLLAAQSQTVLVAAAGSGLVALAVRWVRRFSGFSRALIGSASIAAILTLVYLAIFSFAEVVSGLGRDSTLTGRTDVWPAVVEQIGERPLLGLGWNGAWRDGLPDTQRMWRAAGFKMYHSHDGYLDMMLQLGLVGLAVLVLALLWAIGGGVDAYLRRQERLALWSVGVAMALVLVNLTESPSTNFFGIFVLFIALLLSTERGRPRSCTSSRSSSVRLESAR